MRRCRVCWREDRRKSFMHDRTRHLHELEPGSRFRFEGRREEHELVSVDRARCHYSEPAPANIDGREIPFRKCRPCSGAAQVIPVR